jgi:hypothetical protein
MKNLTTIITSVLLAGTLFFSSCHKDEKIGGTAVQNLSAEWWVKINDGSGLTKYYPLSTYNTAANRPDSMWIDDSQKFYGLKAILHVDPMNNTFTSNNTYEYYYGVNVTITEGKILKGAATAPGSKLKTDSIYFKAQYSDSPGVTFVYSGYARTRFDVDDHY